MSNAGINAKDSTVGGCNNASDITAETDGTIRSLHVKDTELNAAVNLSNTKLDEIESSANTIASRVNTTNSTLTDSNLKLDEVIACLKILKDNREFKIADITLSAVKLITAVSPTNVTYAQPTIPVAGATVYGVTVTSGLAGDNVEVQTFGEVYDSSFMFAVNAPLFLGLNGQITDVAPTTGVLTQVGYGLGDGKIFLNIQDPICL